MAFPFSRDRQLDREGVAARNVDDQPAVERLTDALRRHHPKTHAHSLRVAVLAGSVARAMALDRAAIAATTRTGLLHDIGKLVIPVALLDKPGALSDAERHEMQRHSVLGEELLAEDDGSELARDVRCCHERWDGRGYPDGLVGAQIPLASRIVGACDAMDAMRSSRSYRVALSEPETVRRLISGAGRQFDPRVIEALLAVADPTAGS